MWKVALVLAMIAVTFDAMTVTANPVGGLPFAGHHHDFLMRRF